MKYWNVWVLMSHYSQKIMVAEENYGFPPTYKLILNSLIPAGKLKILDLGCGMGEAAEFLNPKKIHEFTGVDIHKPYLKICKKKGFYKKLICADIKKLNFKNRSFDLVLILQVAEHFDKNTARQLIKKACKIAKKSIIITVPNGGCFQENYDDSVHNEHKSSWNVSDLNDLGFKTFGQGLKIIYGSKSYGGGKKANWWQKILVPLSTFLMPLIIIYPQIAAQLIGVKYLDEEF